MLGVPEAFDRIPGDLVLHPFGHGGLNRSLIRDDALIRARMGVEKSLAGIACKRWGRQTMLLSQPSPPCHRAGILSRQIPSGSSRDTDESVASSSMESRAQAGASVEGRQDRLRPTPRVRKCEGWGFG
eukprot:768027-Hanusia_phi.AAC.2